MKRKIALILAGIMMMSCFAAGCSSSGNETAGETTAATGAETSGETAAAADEERTTFTVGFDASFPPYGYQEDGEYVGFDLDLAQEVCDRNGWELIKTPIDWDAKDMELSSGAIDCIWNGFTMNGREEDYTWSEPYVDNSQVFVVSKASGITSPDELAGKIVLVQKDSSALAALNDEENTELQELKNSFQSLVEVPEYESALLELDAGSADAVAMDIGVAKAKQKNNDNIVILDGEDDIIASEKYAVGFKLGNEELRDQVQATLDEMAADGTFQEIAEKWDLADSICLGK